MRKVLLFIRKYWGACLVVAVLFLGAVYVRVSGFDDLIVEIKDNAFKYAFGGLMGALILWISDQLKSFGQVIDQDFKIISDQSIVIITKEDIAGKSVFRVEVERNFSMKANKDGMYNFERKCKGEWLPESYIQKGKLKPELIPDGDIIKALEPIDVQDGTELGVMLKSKEIIPIENGHYSLSVGSHIVSSTVQWRSLASANAGMKAYIYGETFAIDDIGESVPYPIKDAKEGFNLLIRWNKEQS